MNSNKNQIFCLSFRLIQWMKKRRRKKTLFSLLSRTVPFSSLAKKEAKYKKSTSNNWISTDWWFVDSPYRSSVLFLYGAKGKCTSNIFFRWFHSFHIPLYISLVASNLHIILPFYTFQPISRYCLKTDSTIICERFLFLLANSAMSSFRFLGDFPLRCYCTFKAQENSIWQSIKGP